MRPVAIIGIACRLPGADGPAAFWDLLRRGRHAIGPVPRDRWNADVRFSDDPDAPGAIASTAGGFLDDVRGFDHEFFSITPREAAHMDPQQRLLAETAWEAFDDAGLPATALAGSRTAVYVGIGPGDYARICTAPEESIDAFVNTGNFLSIAANRLSYIFDLRGPSLAVDTACSSSLVAVHMACRSIDAGEATLALAGGVNAILDPAISIGFSRARMLSRSGQCRAFARDADGYVRGEGVGLVVLKPLERAMRDADRVYAVIRGSAVNQDGRRNGLTAPGRWGQEAVLQEAWRIAGLPASDVDYVEAQGTGTVLGDAIEAGAIATVFGGRTDGPPPRIGSVKTNIGHLETAAGIAGLIKTALMIQRGELVPSLHYDAPNPHADPARLGLHVQTMVEPWPETPGRRRLAGVSAFGFGGTNAHVCLSDHPSPVAAPASSVSASTDAHAGGGEAFLLPISARHPDALRLLVRRFAERLVRAPESDVLPICRAAARRRTHHDYRAAFVASSRADLVRHLKAWLDAPDGPPARVRFQRRLTAIAASTDHRVTLDRLAGWGIRPHRVVETLDGPETTDDLLDFTRRHAGAIDATAPPLDIACDLYRRGYTPAWDAIYPGAVPHVDLPRYPWLRQPHWHDAAIGAAHTHTSTRA